MFRTAIILGNRKTKPNAVGAQFKKIKKKYGTSLFRGVSKWDLVLCMYFWISSQI